MLLSSFPASLADAVINDYVSAFQKLMYFSLAFIIAGFLTNLTLTKELVPIEKSAKPGDIEMSPRKI